MKEMERSKLIDLTERAVRVNEKLLSDEKKFIEAVAAGEESGLLQELNQKLNELCRKEYLYLGAAKNVLLKST